MDLITELNQAIDVAFKYGYLSADSFTRAFEKQHGMTPSQVKNESASMELYPPLKFELKVQGALGLSCRIEKKEAFNMFGMATKISVNESVIQEEIDQFVQQGKQEHWYETMNTIYGYDPNMMLHRAFVKREENQVTYMVCQYMKDGIYVPDFYKRVYIPPGLWAVFHSEGEKLSELWARIYSEWLPNASYEISEGPSFEFYYGNAKKGNVRDEIMIPIQKTKMSAKKKSQKRRSARREEDEDMNRTYRVVPFVYEDKWNEPLNQLYMSVTNKYPDGIYWSYDPRTRWGKHMFLCLDEHDHVIGKGHAMVYDKQEDNAPGYAEHRIFMYFYVD